MHGRSSSVRSSVRPLIWAVYLFTARLFASYTDYIIRHNMADFAQIGLIGTPHYREELDQR